MSDQSGVHPAFDLISRLSDARIHYHLAVNRPTMLTFYVAVPGQRWEVDVAEDGTFEIEIFTSDGKIRDQQQLDELFARYADE